MKNLTTLLFFLLLFPFFSNAQPDCYQLIWSDEFEGTSLDESKWSYQRGTWNGSNVQNCYVDENTSVSDGYLKITAKYEPDYMCFAQTRDFTSGFVQTKNKVSWTFGYFEARVKVPVSNSTWPAFWMSPQDPIYGSWPQSGEIDIFEIKGHDMTKSYGNAHWGNSPGDKVQEKGTYNFNNANDWHIYAVEWNLGELKFYIDGVHYHTINDFREPNAATHPQPFDIPYYLRLNVAVGGDYLTEPYNDANNGIDQLPATMEVDWVRVYQKDENCTALSPCEIIENGRFDAGENAWVLRSFQGATGDLIESSGLIKIDVTNSSTSNWHLGLRQEGLLLENGKTYEVSFRAYADANRNSDVIISKPSGVQYDYHAQSLTTTPTEYTYQFTMNQATATNGVISFNVGAENIDVYYDNISIVEVNCNPCSSNLDILDQNIYPDTYQVENQISSNGLIEAGDEVVFQANSIELLGGFEVESGATFEGMILPCVQVNPFHSDLEWGISQMFPNQNQLSSSQENPALLSMEAYPNPLKNDDLSIKYDLGNSERGELLIWDIFGQLVQKVTLKNSGDHSISTQKWPVGTYWMQLRTMQGFVNKKVLKSW